MMNTDKVNTERNEVYPLKSKAYRDTAIIKEHLFNSILYPPVPLSENNSPSSPTQLLPSFTSSKRTPVFRQICWTVFLHNHQMEYAQSLELQRSFRVGVVPLGDTGEDVVAIVQRRLESKEYIPYIHPNEIDPYYCRTSRNLRCTLPVFDPWRIRRLLFTFCT